MFVVVTALAVALLVLAPLLAQKSGSDDAADRGHRRSAVERRRSRSTTTAVPAPPTSAASTVVTTPGPEPTTGDPSVPPGPSPSDPVTTVPGPSPTGGTTPGGSTPGGTGLTTTSTLVVAPAGSALPQGTLPTGVTSGASVTLQCGTEYRGSLNLQGLSSVKVTTTGTCGPAVINGARPVTGWKAAGTNVWSAPVGFTPAQVAAGGRMLELAHTARTGTNPYLTVTGQSGSQLTLGGLTPGADVTGATIRVRYLAYYIADGTVTGGSGPSVTTSGLPAGENMVGWGAYLEGKRWMLDEPGEWVFENGTLYVYGAAAPVGVEASPAGPVIDADNSTGVTIDGVAVRNGPIGISAERSTGLTLRSVAVANTTDHGIYAECARTLSMTASAVSSTGRDGLRIGYCGADVTVTDSTFTDIGTVLMPRKTEAAVFGGFTDKLTVRNSRFTNVGYVAIRFFTGGRIESNVIDKACMTLGDCGAIYTFDRDHKGLAATVSGNQISGVMGNDQGAKDLGTHVFGIYLDDESNGVTVSDNTVTGSRYGLYLHGAFANVASGNTFRNNLDAHLLLADWGFPAGTIHDNVVRDNRFGPGRAIELAGNSGDDRTRWATFSGSICEPGATDCRYPPRSGRQPRRENRAPSPNRVAKPPVPGGFATQNGWGARFSRRGSARGGSGPGAGQGRGPGAPLARRRLIRWRGPTIWGKVTGSGRVMDQPPTLCPEGGGRCRDCSHPTTP